MPDRSNIRILIIDDDAEYAGVLRLHLAAAGYATEVAEDAIEGGKALLERPPVVFISGRSDASLMARAAELGAADFLAKPVTREQLLQTVEACLRAGGRRAALPNYGFPPVV